MSRLRRSWGLIVYSALSLLALVRLLLQATPGHYRVFAGAGHALWHGQSPYASAFGTGVGYFFYSPACAMLVFGPLSALPEKLGMIIYMSISWAVFTGGALRLFEVFSPRSSRTLQWFWVAIAAQMVGGILASKLEVLIAGLLLLAFAWILNPGQRRKARVLGAAVILALVLNWKFQPLPVVGLFFLVWILVERDWIFPAVLAGSLASAYALPFAFFPTDSLIKYHESWRASLSVFVQEAFLNFENIFAFLHNSLGVPVSLGGSQFFSAVTALACTLFLLLWLKRLGPTTSSVFRLRGGTLLALALGTVFMTAFSPLGQNNALILYAPLLLVGFVCLDARSPDERTGWTLTLGVVWAMMTLLYSDLIPLALRDHLRHLSLKPLACIGLGIAVAQEAWRGRGIFDQFKLSRPADKTV